MSFISTPTADIGKATATMYASAETSYGYLPNMFRIFGHRPEVMERWGELLSSIRGQMNPRRYELVTLAAARELKSSYCMLAHGSALLRHGFSNTQLADTILDGSHAPLDENEREIMDFAGMVVRDATGITKKDIDRLKATGLTDEEIFDIAATAAARCFFSKILDAMGAEPDAIYRDRLAPELTQSLTLGRKIEGSFQAEPAAQGN